MNKRTVTLLVAVLLFLAAMAPAQAITNGVPDEDAHPYVGQLLFYVPDAVDPRFEDPGSWFNCTGTLVDSRIVVTAGHCTFAIGKDGASTTAGGGPGSGGTDVWVNFSEEPDYSILQPSSTFVPDRNEDRYAQWSAALDKSPEWREATAYPHPEYNDEQFVLHDLGVLVLAGGLSTTPNGDLPIEGLLDTLARNKRQTYTAVGYGLEESRPHSALGGDRRMRATLKLVNAGGAFGYGGATAKFSSNNGRPHRGGTCFGDSGGPVFVGRSNVLVGVVSFGVNPTCSGSSGVYRIDQEDDLRFLATFGVTP